MFNGILNAGDTIDFKFTTRSPVAVPTALTSGAVSVYKNNDTTESTAGVTLTANFDSRTGLNHVRITTASDGTFYSNGSLFQCVLTGGTVDGVSVVGEVIGQFALVAPYQVAKNTALAGFMVFMRDATNPAAGKTGLTVTATRSIDGAAFAACANAVSEVSNGWYKIDLAAADLNGGTIALNFAATGAVTSVSTIITQTP